MDKVVQTGKAHSWGADTKMHTSRKLRMVKRKEFLPALVSVVKTQPHSLFLSVLVIKGAHINRR